MVVVCFASALGVVYNRRSVLAGVATAIILFALMFFFDSFFLALGKGARLPAFWAVWTTKIVFGAVGVLLLRQRALNRDKLFSRSTEKKFPISILMLQEWTIQARTDRCDVTGQPFADGEFFYTLLYRDRHDTLSRRDVSAEGWRQLKADRDRAASVLVLAVEIRPAAPARTRSVAQGRRRDAPAPFPRREPSRARPRRVHPRPHAGTQTRPPPHRRPAGRGGGRRLLFYEHAATGETFVVADPGLRLDQLEEVQREVGELLKTPGRNCPPAPEPPRPDSGPFPG